MVCVAQQVTNGRINTKKEEYRSSDEICENQVLQNVGIIKVILEWKVRG